MSDAREQYFHCPRSQALGEFLSAQPLDARLALAEGRVFVGVRRIGEPNHPLKAGDIVRVAVSRRVDSSLQVLLEVEGIVAVNKPHDWVSEPDAAGTTANVRDGLQRLLNCRRVHVATRLDVGVSGLVLAAVSESAKAHLTRLQHEGALHRRYLALAAGVCEKSGLWEGEVAADAAPGVRRTRQAKAGNCAADRAESTVPATAFECLSLCQSSLFCSGTSEKQRTPVARGLPTPASVALLDVAPRTGRKHQIRIHASRAGLPLLGDRRYGGCTRLTAPDGRVIALARIALHAHATELTLPSGRHILVSCPVADDFADLWQQLGGALSLLTR